MLRFGLFSRGRRRGSGLLGLVLVALCISGCGGDGAGHVQVSGKVTFNGSPVPAGQIVFEPDPTAGNAGATGFAEIVNGHFDTSDEGGQGTVGGPHVVRITGLSGKAGTPGAKPLFREYQTSADLGQESGSKDFEVPAEAAQGLVVGEDA